ncbi:MAG: N-acetyltransferase [Rickettsiales bacterium]|nr:N-acetyltransferase [Rickettsiales bacterium]|tara:strand:- start:1821 stop:2408 length:588 start_codon:yes stop_codon:yes gene_type:complete
MTETAYVHPSSVIDEDVELGPGTRVWFFCHVQRGARIGARCILGQNVNIDSHVVIGSGVKIQNNVSVYRSVTIEDDCFLGPSCVFTNVINPRAHIERKHEFLPTRVGRGSSIGANATIVCGNQLGRYCMVGAGAVVTRDVPAHALVVGVPARQVGWVCRCGEQIEVAAERAHCEACGDRYQQNETGLQLLGGAGG